MTRARPALMVVDLMLPNVSGSAFLHYVQTEPITVRFRASS
jgi:CheY-like chemotaxis protein